jgi:YrbI family 3-deoxy-D-manno-octulosonate 8-phosphate phosphatase
MSRNPSAALLRAIRLAVFDFDGVFTNNRVIVSEDGEESVVCNRSDGLGLRRLESAKVQTLILSTETNPVVMHRARKLKIRCIHGVEDKAGTLREEAARMGIPLRQVAFVANDINDSGCLQAVGLPVVVADAWPEVRPLARWVLKRRGGEGAVREFCDAVWRAASGASRSGKRGGHG